MGKIYGELLIDDNGAPYCGPPNSIIWTVGEWTTVVGITLMFAITVGLLFGDKRTMPSP